MIMQWKRKVGVDKVTSMARVTGSRSSYRICPCGVRIHHSRRSWRNLHGVPHCSLPVSLPRPEPSGRLWAICWPLLDGDSIGGPLQTLPEKAEAKARGVGTKTLITLVSKNVIAARA